MPVTGQLLGCGEQPADAKLSTTELARCSEKGARDESQVGDTASYPRDDVTRRLCDSVTTCLSDAATVRPRDEIT
jgi:hypothetical protein